MSQKQKILLIPNHEDNIWTSINSLKESFLNYWLKYEKSFQISILEEIQYPYSKMDYLKTVGVDFLIFLRLDSKSAMFLDIVRKEFNQTAKIIAYTEETPSIGFFNYQVLKLDSILNTGDLLIAQNKRDLELIRTFTNMPCEFAPGLVPKNLIELNKQTKKIKNLCYIGRISPQKNIHSLFFSVSLIQKELRKQEMKLYIFGHQDNFGSPNMAIPGGAYLEELYYYSQELGISDLIIFEEFQSDTRKMYEQIIELQCLNISLSLHSDEDFGFSILECSYLNIPSIITDWGGYHNFIESFSSLVTPIDVYHSDYGPFVSFKEVGNSILKIISDFDPQKSELNKIEKFINPKALIIDNERKQTSPMEFTQKADKIHKQAILSPMVKLGDREWPQHGIIFKSYKDPLVHEIFKFYGAIDFNKKFDKSKSYIRAPWVHKGKDFTEINDPHRGNHILKNNEATEKFLFKLGYLSEEI